MYALALATNPGTPDSKSRNEAPKAPRTLAADYSGVWVAMTEADDLDARAMVIETTASACAFLMS